MSSLARFGFVIVDVALKIFFFVFTFQASHLLTRADFDLLSYFRSTLTMCVGALTSTVGLYFLVYARKMHGSPKYGIVYFSVPVVFFLTLLVAISALLATCAEAFKLDKAIGAMGLINFLGAIAVASFAQVVLIYRKAQSSISTVTVVGTVICLVAAVGLGQVLIEQLALPGAAYYICLGYGIMALIVASARGSQAPRRGQASSARTKWLVALLLVKRFMLPNFVETVFSIVAPWLAVYALVSNAGMTGVGPVLFYQSLVGLPVFLIYSLVLNDHAQFRCDRSGSPQALHRFHAMYVAFFALVVLVAGGLGMALKRWLNLADLSSLTIVLLFAASLLQSELIAKGMVFKKAGESAKTMRHNAVYSVALCVGSYFLTLRIGIEGYAAAVFLAWLVAYAYVNIDFHRTFTLQGAAMWREVALLVLGFAALVLRDSVHPVVPIIIAMLIASAMIHATMRLRMMDREGA